MSRGAQAGAPRQTTRSVARGAMMPGRSVVNITEDVRKYAAEQVITQEEALQRGMEEPSAARSTNRRIAREGEAQRSKKSKEVMEKGEEVYAKA